MMDDPLYKGYKGRGLEVLRHFQAAVWSDITFITPTGRYTGIVLPRSETADADHIVLKLRSGYNIGIRADRVTGVEIYGRKEAHYKIPEKEFPYDPVKPRV
ncbi:MAG: Glu-tRNA(Gln) amidotransferase GatDE subunit D, partial [Candidatus Aminicenantales bacterium]